MHRTLPLGWIGALALALQSSAGCVTPKHPEDALNTTHDAPLRPPVAPQRPHTLSAHGEDREDPWYWLRDREDPQVLAYLTAENTFTEAALADQAPLRQRLYTEMKGRMAEEDASAPMVWGGWAYYTRTVAGAAYPLLCRKDASRPDAPEELLLDVNALAEGHDFYSLGAWEPSPDHHLLAFLEDTEGDEIYTLRVKDLTTGAMLTDTITDVGDSLSWAMDGKTLLYTVQDDTLRPYEARRHTLGTPADVDPPVYTEEDERFYVYVDRTRTDAYLVVSTESMVTSEVRVVDARTPGAPLHLLQPRHPGMMYSIEHDPAGPRGERFLILTDDADDASGAHTLAALNHKLMEAPVTSTSKAQWTELIPHRDDVQLLAVEAFRDHLVLHERAEGQGRLVVMDRTGARRPVPLPEASYDLWLETNPAWETTALRFGYSSMVTPDTVYSVDLTTLALTRLHTEKIEGGYDPTRYTSTLLQLPSKDGTLVPVSLVHRADLEPDGTHPLLVEAYGAYGMPYDPHFSQTRLSMLDRGVVYALCHARGGGEKGRAWYEDGKLMNKRHTFEDVIACAEGLRAAGWAHPHRMAVRGGSAGGLMVGAVVAMAPTLFQVALAEVPFVDVVTSMSDETIPLTATEWEEWGDPRQPEPYTYMRGYSPYDNVHPGPWPRMLVTAGLNDPRVQYWEPAKWVAKMRHVLPDAEVYLKTEMDSGHQGATDRYEALEEEAFVVGFLLASLGVGN